jgi:predicted Zn finger-like uncharacterized protein
VKFLCDQCKTKYQIADEKAAGKTLRMKCRKCGHLIEVRAATAATTIASTPPPAGPSPASPANSPQGPPPRPGARPPAKPAAAPLASNLAAAKPPPKPEKPGALAGAFKTTVKDDEVSAPFDMSDLSGNDEWYVAVNGVPVGPIRVAEIRRKAANGAVTEDSLAWQEGLDEWRAVRSFPELAAVVREAIATGRPSLTPVPPEGRPSHPPQSRSSGARASLGPQHLASPPPRGRPHEPATARSNVVPISSRLATAERLAAEDLTIPIESEFAPEPVAVADPFAGAGPARPAPAPSMAPSMPPRRKWQVPWIPILVGAAMVFGITAGATFFRPAPTQQIIYQQVPTPAGPSASAAPTSSVADTTAADPATPSKGPVAMGGPRSNGPAPAASAPSKGTIDLGGLRGGRVSPLDNAAGGDEQRAPGQCLTSGMVGGVINNHQVGVRRSCWDKSPSTKPAANVSVSLTVGTDGAAQGVSASGDEPSVAKCVEDNVRQWRFPAMGCSQAVNIPFHFVR